MHLLIKVEALGPGRVEARCSVPEQKFLYALAVLLGQGLLRPGWQACARLIRVSLRRLVAIQVVLHLIKRFVRRERFLGSLVATLFIFLRLFRSFLQKAERVIVVVNRCRRLLLLPFLLRLNFVLINCCQWISATSAKAIQHVVQIIRFIHHVVLLGRLFSDAMEPSLPRFARRLRPICIELLLANRRVGHVAALESRGVRLLAGYCPVVVIVVVEIVDSPVVSDRYIGVVAIFLHEPVLSCSAYSPSSLLIQIASRLLGRLRTGILLLGSGSPVEEAHAIVAIALITLGSGPSQRLSRVFLVPIVIVVRIGHHVRKVVCPGARSLFAANWLRVRVEERAGRLLVHANTRTVPHAAEEILPRPRLLADRRRF